MIHSFLRSILMLALNLTSSHFSLAQSIQMDLPIPKEQPPPVDPHSEQQRLLDIKRQHRRGREKKHFPPSVDHTFERNKKLLEEMVENRPDHLHVASWLVQPFGMVRPPRQGYVFEPTMISSGIWRLTNQREKAFDVWLGGRIAAFSGTGRQQDLSARFGFLYFGPMVSIGRIAPAPASIGREASRPGADLSKFFETRSAWFVSTGISFQSRYGFVDRGTIEIPEDFGDQSVAYDFPGIWAEAAYSWIHFGALSLSFMGGIHLGSGKDIYYLGPGIGGIF